MSETHRYHIHLNKSGLTANGINDFLIEILKKEIE